MSLIETDKLDQLKAKIKEFEEIQWKHSKTGAYDTEPDCVFQVLLVEALTGTMKRAKPEIGFWQLFSGDDIKADSQKAAEELTVKANEIIEFIQNTPIYEAGVFTRYLDDYCWRI
jgi:hypothetical protein